jgi:hypothetical protein
VAGQEEGEGEAGDGRVGRMPAREVASAGQQALVDAGADAPPSAPGCLDQQPAEQRHPSSSRASPPPRAQQQPRRQRPQRPAAAPARPRRHRRAPAPAGGRRRALNRTSSARSSSVPPNSSITRKDRTSPAMTTGT